MTGPVRTLVATALLAVASLSAQTPQAPTFRGAAELVQIDVVVLDAQRRPVMGLTQADFTVSEEGRAKAIEAFSPVTLSEPTAPSAAMPATADAGATGGVEPAVPGRLVVIMFDRSIPMEQPTVTARRIAHAAVASLGAGDMASIIRSSRFKGEGSQVDFTADRAKLNVAIDEPFVGQVAPPTMAGSGLVYGPANMTKTGDCYCGLCSLEAFERVATSLAGDPRQKSILFIGGDIVIQESLGEGECAPHQKRVREAALRALDRANATVHAIDPTGLQTLAANADRGAPRPGAARGELARQGNLRVLPSYTGGRTVLNTNDPNLAVAALFTESRSYYLLGIRPSDGKAGQRRSLKVTVKQDGVTVRSRSSYFIGG
jgi:VWFA-related protein